ncbi:MAG: helicase [Oceanospirillaceae bacterium]|nr:helicase [Oceanospirillaceae bacterium]|tara:strand:- start:39 stop:3482 length:3444 start_codon:yes stop_codon:yes gene_type:complete
MALKKWIKRLVGQKEAQRYRQAFDFEGANFLCSEEQLSVIQQGKADDLITQQHIVLRMLVEEGEGVELPNGFMIPSRAIVSLDEFSRDILELPAQWKGSLKADIQGQTGRSSFNIEIQANHGNSRFTGSFRLNGPVIRFSEEHQFLLSTEQLHMFKALEAHENSERTEFDNLSVIAALQHAQKSGISIELGHFEKLRIHTPESVAVEAELDESGNLILTPQLGQDASHEEMQRVLGQLKNRDTASLRVKNEIVLIDEEKMAGIQEILKNRIVSKDKLDDFYRNPTAFIDGSLVNLELGFSARVKGAAHFRHAYLGETDESGIDWFGKKFASTNIYPVNKLADVITDETQLKSFESAVEQAEAVKAQEVEFEGKVYDISDSALVGAAVQNIRELLLKPTSEYSDFEEPAAPYDTEEDTSPVVVDIVLNDDDLETPSNSIERKLADVLVPVKNLCWDNYRRKPYPHQQYGVRWLLGLVNDPNEPGGCLLADDMGLGKTFMSLAAIEHLYQNWENGGVTVKPCLVIAPLSLLQNWKDEVEKTFVISPFRDVVILQSDGDLNQYRCGGVETKNQSFEDGEAVIRYSLKIGSDFGSERLDMPRRLVITTYQTLRDYQFSLCSVDWSVAAFDEAQNIKNPNALQTRAAKGLKAEFRLLATGTPVENSLADFWCLMDTACPGFLGSYQSFRDQYVTPIVRAASDELEETRARVGRQLRNTVGALMLRRLKEDNLEGLPAKHLYVGVENSDWEYLEELSSYLEGEQLVSYDSVLSGVSEAEENAVLAGLHQLRDVSLHHRLLMEGKLDVPTQKSSLSELMAESGKFKSLLLLLKDIQSRHEKVIIFCINKRLQAFLSVALARYFGMPLLSVINGDTKAIAKKKGSQTRKTMIEAFEHKEGFNIIVMSPVAAGVGLTVVGANNVVHLERHWNPAKEAQATDRVYRIGQQKDVNVYIPIVRHPELMSFDENLHQLLSKKSSLRDAVVTPEQVLPEPEGFVQSGFTDGLRIEPEHLRSLSWQQFEALAAELLAIEWQATSCMLTNDGPDHGADAVVQVDGKICLLQCKHTNNQSTFDGYKAVQEVYGAKPVYESGLGQPVEKLLFVTNACRLGNKTRATAKDCGVEVLDGSQLARLLREHDIPFSLVNKRLQARRCKV